MNIQSLSIAVPASCPNKCKFCVAHMHRDAYENHIEKNQRFRHLYKQDYKKRLAFARDNGCNTLMFTGNGEPMMNQDFIQDVADWNTQIDKPFRNIELQTSGWGLNEGSLRWLRNEIGVVTISLSLSALRDKENAEYNGSKNWELDIRKTCNLIKKYDFNLRLSLNMTDWFEQHDPISIVWLGREFGADQVIFRELYAEGNTPEANWVNNHKLNYTKMMLLTDYIVNNGKKLRTLPYGATVYDVQGVSTVIDGDCMNQEVSENIKYMILRENCKLYSHWESTGSLIF